MRISKKILFILLTCWMLFASADQEKLPEEFFTNAEFYSKFEMIEQLSALETISDDDLSLAQHTDIQDTGKADGAQ